VTVSARELARRTFTKDDQRAFARISGDWNPLHIDEALARRTMYGAPIVHGVHLLLWALDAYARTTLASSKRLDRLRVYFRRPVYLDQAVVVRTRADDASLTLLVNGADGVAVEAVLATTDVAPAAANDVPFGRWDEPACPRALSAENAGRASGEIPLLVDEAEARRLFGAATGVFGIATIAELLATTRLVGMTCPGLHSIFSACSLRRAETGRRGPTLTYEVVAEKHKYSMLTLGVRGAVFEGMLETFVRPVPRTTSMAATLRAVPHDRFSGQRALVVGGSRGLGEAFAKVIAAGGGDVCITYNRGASDAEAVVNEICSTGRRATAIKFDVLDPRDLSLRWPASEPPTHLYYFATPTLFAIRKGASFKHDELHDMIRYYVTGLHDTVAAALELGGKALVVWTPSTTMLDDVRGGASYCIAKAAMEELCRHLPSLFPVIVHTPRINRVDTDQTQSLIHVPGRPPLDVAVDELSRLCR
jgi:acyl dehydratase